MKNPGNSISWMLFVISVCIVMIGCSSQMAASMRKVTYPPDFTYTKQADLRTDMDQLAKQMVILEQALVAPSADIDNATAAPAFHGWQARLNALDHRPYVDVDHLIENFEIYFLNRRNNR